MSLSLSAFKSYFATKMNGANPNCPTSGTTEIEAICQGVISELTTAIVTYSDSPTYQMGGIISNMEGSRMADTVKDAAGYPNVSSKLLALCNAIVDHLLTGICNAGSITGLSSSTLAQDIADAIGEGVITAEVTAMAEAIVEYVTNNAVAGTGAPTCSIS